MLKLLISLIPFLIGIIPKILPIYSQIHSIVGSIEMIDLYCSTHETNTAEQKIEFAKAISIPITEADITAFHTHKTMFKVDLFLRLAQEVGIDKTLATFCSNLILLKNQ